jgi:hypothetical protein
MSVTGVGEQPTHAEKVMTTEARIAQLIVSILAPRRRTSHGDTGSGVDRLPIMNPLEGEAGMPGVLADQLVSFSREVSDVCWERAISKVVGVEVRRMSCEATNWRAQCS